VALNGAFLFLVAPSIGVPVNLVWSQVIKALRADGFPAFRHVCSSDDLRPEIELIRSA
jgi:hypothetical protein